MKKKILSAVFGILAAALLLAGCAAPVPPKDPPEPTATSQPAEPDCTEPKRTGSQ